MKKYLGFALTLFLSASLFIQCSGVANAQLYNPPTLLTNATVSGTNSNFNGTLNLNNNLLPVSGAGIDFSLGGVSPTTVSTTTSTKIFKEYVRGTWTPSFIGATSSPSSVTYSNNVGTFIKTDNQVCYAFRVLISAITGGGGSAYVSGTPYVVSASAPVGGGSVVEKSGWLTAGPDFLRAGAGLHAIQLLANGVTTVNSVNISNMTTSALVSGQGCYITSE